MKSIKITEEDQEVYLHSIMESDLILFLIYLRGEGWDELEPYFYGDFDNEEWIKIAIEKFKEWSELKNNIK